MVKAAPMKVRKAAAATSLLQKLSKNSMSGNSYQTNVTMFKHDRDECLEICRLLTDSEVTVGLKLVQNQITEELISAIVPLDVNEISVYGTSAVNGQMIEMLSRVNSVKKLSYRGKHPGSLKPLESLRRLTTLCLMVPERINKDDLQALSSVESLKVLLVQTSTISGAEMRKQLSGLEHLHVLTEVNAMPDGEQKREAHMLFGRFTGRFDASRGETTRLWPNSAWANAR